MKLMQELIRELEQAREAATLEKASFGFPNDSIAITREHLGDQSKIGTEVHPTEYIQRMVKLHHESWIISRIDRVLGLLRAHEKKIEDSEQLVETLEDLDGLSYKLRLLLSRVK